MRSAFRKTAAIAIVALFGAAAYCAAQSNREAGSRAEDTTPTVMPAKRPSHAPMTQSSSGISSPERGPIKAIEDQIHAVRQQYKTQADPLESQLKALRDKLDADLKPLEAQRKELIEQAESPELRALNEDETSQLAAISDKEKAEIDKLRASYEDQKHALRQTFEQRRRDLRVAKK